ncbi:MAG: glycoside hydrolase family 127 protein [Bacteroides sp.]|nr:glycoside hydrolase family 127 protein [Bacteroides sp.]
MLLFTLSYCFTLQAQIPVLVEKFPLTDVTLLESPFKHAEELDKEYLLALDADRLLAPYLKEAGLSPKKENYTNWENMGLDGHIGGHYVSALSLMYASTGDSRIKERLDYMIAELKRCQDHAGTGYVGGVPGSKELWEEVAKAENETGGFSLGNRCVPLYNIHKIYAGLRDAYLIAGIEDAKEMLVKMTDWFNDLLAGLTDEQVQNMLRSEHGGLNEIFADVADITGDKKYLQMARRFSHRAILDPLLEQRDDLTGKHANTQIPKVIGYKRIADLDGDSAWDEASRFFWETVVKGRSVSIGGNSSYEHFHPTHDFSSMIYGEQGSETCNTYNMLRLTGQLYRTSKDPSYMDYYERAVYNHILSTQHPETGGLVYFTQMRPGHYRVYSQPQTSFWCCIGSGIENHARYGEMIYGHQGDDLYVNLFIPSRLTWKEKNREIIQETRFPDEEQICFTVNPQKSSTFTINLRYPEWVKAGEAKVSVNEKEIPVDAQPGSYITLSRKWKKGDRIELTLPMHTFVEQMPDGSDFVSILHGPVVLAAKTTTEGQVGLFADDSRGGHIAHGPKIPLHEMPLLLGEPETIPDHVKPVEGKPLTFTLTNLYPEKFAELELIPFSRLHGSRYIIYWQTTTPEKLQELQKQIERTEKERMELDAITVDYITCGEQQPESDHFYQGERSGTGLHKDIHYREARGFFSYQLKNKGYSGKNIRITYLGTDDNRECIVTINGEPAGTIRTTGNQEEFSVIEFPVPEELERAETFRIQLQAAEGKQTPRIFHVRIVNQ